MCGIHGIITINKQPKQKLQYKVDRMLKKTILKQLNTQQPPFFHIFGLIALHLNPKSSNRLRCTHLLY